MALTKVFNRMADDFVVGDDGKKYRVVSCVLRQDSAGSGWYAIDDGNHRPVGLDPTTPVSESNGNIILNYNFTGQKIGSLLVAPDEGYANSNLSFGSSVTNSSAIISLYHPFWARTSGTGVVAHSYFGSMASSAALTDGDWYAEYTTADGTWVFTHASESHSDATGSVVSVEGFGEDTSGSPYEVTARSKTSFTVETRQQIHGKTNGASAILSDNAGTFTASWDGTDTWTITHPESASVYDVIVSCISPQYTAGIQSSNTTQFTLKFYNVATGAAYTGASIPTNIYFMRGGVAACALTGGTKFKAERLGKCKVDAQYVSGGSSNLWVHGLFEI